jgi:deoxyinosine 3'endonuclease (endonuclease V)
MRLHVHVLEGGQLRFVTCWVGHPQDMDTGGHPDCGVCAAVDVHFLGTAGARAAAVLAADATFAYVQAERTAVVPWVPPYRPGEFYLRELPPLRAVLEGLRGLGLLVVDGCADLDPGGRPGLGAMRTPSSASR